MITIVAGLPRSGTSLAMRLLAELGLPLIQDAHRPPDSSNPDGYFEHRDATSRQSIERLLQREKSGVLKVLFPLGAKLPSTASLRFLIMRRDLEGVAQSQAQMLRKRGVIPESHATTLAALNSLLQRSLESLEQRNAQVVIVDYETLIESPQSCVEGIAAAFRLESSPLAIRRASQHVRLIQSNKGIDLERQPLRL